MTLTEVCLLSITISTIASAGALIGIVLHLRGASRKLEGLARDTSASARRIDEVGAELQSFIHRANHDYGQVSDALRLVLGEAVLPVKGVASLIQGVRAGIGLFFHLRPRLLNSTRDERNRT